MAEERSLPGWPKKRLVKEVRRHLSCYGFRPVKQAAWQAAWSWANKIAHSYFHVHWPLASENRHAVHPAPLGRNARLPLPAIALSGQRELAARSRGPLARHATAGFSRD